MSGDDELDAFEREFHDYGTPPAALWLSPWVFDGHPPLAPRRPELVGDQTDALWTDLATWARWAITTFRLTGWFPPCWPQHPALVEELLALWWHWQTVWLPGTDGTAPVSFLRELEWALGRCERLWKPPCTTDRHKPQPDPTADAHGTPSWRQWWSNPGYPDDKE